MAYNIRLSSVPFFQFMSEEITDQVARLFEVVDKKAGENIVLVGQEVTGFYIVAEGTVEVYSDNFEVLVSILGPGNVFGEMALIEDVSSSACLRVGKEPAKLLFCGRQEFENIIKSNSDFAMAFYHGAALILSQRLRERNRRLRAEMVRGKHIISDMINSGSLISKLGMTRGSISNTGESMIAKISTLLPLLKELAEVVPEDKKALVATVRQTVTSVLTIESQNFDIITQQIDHIHQYVVNIDRIISGESAVEIQGDKNIFAISAKKTEDITGDVEVF